MDAPTIYHIHPDTLEFIGLGLADPDPLAGEEENWLIPAFAFSDVPPESREGYAIVRDLQRGAWEWIEDNRGIVYATDTGDAEEHFCLGPLPSTLTRTPYPGAFHTWSGSEWVVDIEALRADALAQAVDLNDKKLAEASMRIMPLEDAVDIGVATEEEQASLRAWKRYRIELNRVPQQIGYPLSIQWPLSPENVDTKRLF
ncbi:tail fiber assembly protein [Pseudomonas juntendi]|uniref:tail fiber assembly protein n=1 Tax=Pseudomonas TaxID=286 RepID=UPI0034D3AD0E